MKNIVCIALAFILTIALNAQEDLTKYGIADEVAPKGLAIGAELPAAKGQLADKKLVSLNDLQGEGALVVVFFRGSWCPYCNQQLSDIADSKNLFQEKGAKIVAITPEKGDQEELDDSGIIFIYDNTTELMQTFDVDFKVTDGYQKKLKTFKNIELAEHNGQEEAILPVPGTFIFNKEGKLVARYFDINYKERPSAEWILERLP